MENFFFLSKKITICYKIPKINHEKFIEEKYVKSKIMQNMYVQKKIRRREFMV